MASQLFTIPLQHPEALFIGGRWVSPSTDVASSTDEFAASVAGANIRDVERAIAAAREAFDLGPRVNLSPDERASWLRAIADAFLRRQNEFARLWSTAWLILYGMAASRIGGHPAGAFNSWFRRRMKRTPRIANDTIFGLDASVFTIDASRFRSVAAESSPTPSFTSPGGRPVAFPEARVVISDRPHDTGTN